MTAAHYFPTADEMRADLAPVVADVAEQLGSVSDIYELAPVRQADFTTKLVPNLLVYSDAEIKLDQLTSDEAQEIFGLNVNTTMQGKMSRVTEVKIDQVFDVTAGDFSARRYQVKSVIERPLSDSYLLGLVDYEGEL